MLYTVTYRDGSQELVDASSIKDAREQGAELFEEPIKNVRVASDDLDEDTDSEDEDEEDENPGDEEDSDDE